MKERFEIGDKKMVGQVQVEVVQESVMDIFQEPEEVPLHEAYHMAANPFNVDWATVTPNGDSLGSTKLINFDPIAAIAPHVKGMKGTDMDRIIIRSHGASESSASIGANGVSDELAYAIAGVLQAKKEMNGDETIAVAKEVKDGKKVKTVKTYFDGRKEIVEEKTNWKSKTIDIILEEDEEYSLPKAA